MNNMTRVRNLIFIYSPMNIISEISWISQTRNRLENERVKVQHICIYFMQLRIHFLVLLQVISKFNSKHYCANSKYLPQFRRKTFLVNSVTSEMENQYNMVPNDETVTIIFFKISLRSVNKHGVQNGLQQEIHSVT